MNNPYLYPDQAPWTPESIERDLDREERIRHQIELQILQEEYDWNYGRIPRRPGR